MIIPCVSVYLANNERQSVKPSDQKEGGGEWVKNKRRGNESYPVIAARKLMATIN